jgi:hypothetical protein
MSLGVTLRVHVTSGEEPVGGARIVQDNEEVGTDQHGLGVVRGVGSQFQMFEVTANGLAPTSVSMWLASDPGGTIERTVTLSRGLRLEAWCWGRKELLFLVRRSRSTASRGAAT